MILPLFLIYLVLNGEIFRAVLSGMTVVVEVGDVLFSYSPVFVPVKASSIQVVEFVVSISLGAFYLMSIFPLGSTGSRQKNTRRCLMRKSLNCQILSGRHYAIIPHHGLFVVQI